jgi:hypothetical protein
MPILALVDDGFLVFEEEFDRILDGQDVAGTVVRCGDRASRDGRRLAGAGGADDQDQAALFHDDVGQHRRQAERVIKFRNVAEDEADDDADAAALAEDVDPEVADLGAGRRRGSSPVWPRSA